MTGCRIEPPPKPHTRVKWDSASPSQRDQWVATHVFGWTGNYPQVVPPYATDPLWSVHALFHLQEAGAIQGWSVTCNQWEVWTVTVTVGSTVHKVNAAKPEEAITMAALYAVGVHVK